MEKIKIYIKAIAIPLIVGGVVGFLISKSIDYNDLEKPPLSPPSILFPIMWTILYILMGVSYGMLQNKSLVNDQVKLIYYVQLVVNAFWSIFFFLLKWRFFSFLWIVLLAILVYTMIKVFKSKDKIAGILQIPYLLWVVFATYLNLGVYILNR